MALERIGVFAGAFDPIHDGHIDFINQSMRDYHLDRVFILIEKKSKYKQIYADFKHRRKMVELSISGEPRIEIYESSSASFPLSSTLPKIKKQYQAEFYLLVGHDVAEHIQSWPDAKSILEGVKFVVADRRHGKHRRISSGKIREEIIRGTEEIAIPKKALNYCLRNNLYS